jgi:hypothetical protein
MDFFPFSENLSKSQSISGKAIWRAFPIFLYFRIMLAPFWGEGGGEGWEVGRKAEGKGGRRRGRNAWKR